MYLWFGQPAFLVLCNLASWAVGYFWAQLSICSQLGYWVLESLGEEMPIELTVQKLGDNLVPVTAADREALENVKQGKAFRVTAVRVSDRSLQHHRLYFGGLVRLVADYWEPESGLISRYDKKVMDGLIDWVANQGKNTEALCSLIELYLHDRAETIKQHLPEYENAAAKLQNIHDWLKEEAGYYDATLTLWGRNLTDDDSTDTISDTAGQFGRFIAYPKEPLTWGVTLRKNW